MKKKITSRRRVFREMIEKERTKRYYINIARTLHEEGEYRAGCPFPSLIFHIFLLTLFLPLPSHGLASVITPSYSLDLIYSSVRSKCRLGFSKDELVLGSVGLLPLLLVCRFEWISSIKPFRYLVVTVSFC
jgi:hypothetical protein